jgi:hypothetical protein
MNDNIFWFALGYVCAMIIDYILIKRTEKGDIYFFKPKEGG